MSRTLRNNETRSNEGMDPSHDLRNTETRDNETMADYDMFYQGSAIPKGVRRPGYEYQWVNISIRGEATANIENAYRMGGEMVSRDRAPQRATDPLGRNPLAQKYICRKDTVLMEFPIEVFKAVKARDAALTAKKLNSLIGVNDDSGSVSSIGPLKRY